MSDDELPTELPLSAPWDMAYDLIRNVQRQWPEHYDVIVAAARERSEFQAALRDEMLYGDDAAKHLDIESARRVAWRADISHDRWEFLLLLLGEPGATKAR